MDSWTDTTKHVLLRETGLFQSEAAFLVQIFPWETEFMNNAPWSPRGARAGERTHTAGDTWRIFERGQATAVDFLYLFVTLCMEYCVVRCLMLLLSMEWSTIQ